MQKEIHIVICQDRYGHLMIGCLPLSIIPKSSNLRDALFDKRDYCVKLHSIGGQGGGILGIYEEKYLAQEHMKIEQGWRNDGHMAAGMKFWIQTIKAKNYKRNRES